MPLTDTSAFLMVSFFTQHSGMSECPLSRVSMILYQYTRQPLFMCLEVICCVPIKAFIQVPASAEVGEKSLWEGTKKCEQLGKLLGWVLQGTLSSHCCPEPIAPSLFICLSDIWFARRQLQPSIAQLLSDFL